MEIEIERKETVPSDRELKEAERIRKTLIQKNKDIHEVLNLKMHDTAYLTQTGQNVFRVYGGWVYSEYDNDNGNLASSTFVPDNRNITEKNRDAKKI